MTVVDPRETHHHTVAISRIKIFIISKVYDKILNHRDTSEFCEIHLRQYQIVENNDIAGSLNIPHNSIHRPFIHIKIHEQVAFLAIKRHVYITIFCLG